MRPASLFHTQHPLLKVIVTLALSIGIIIAQPLQLGGLFLLLLLYFALFPSLILHWLKLLLKLLPLFITICLFGIISGNDFYGVLMLSARLAILLLLSAYLFKTVEIEELAALLPRHKGFQAYLAATLLFVPLFFAGFQEARRQTNNPATLINLSLELTHAHLEEIREQVYNSKNPQTGYSYKADATGIGLLIISLTIFIFLR
ncbi:MAG: hypothetical protein K9N06_04700 [Candidatus Cloacimonetes bacterium]|nr:hypothetical protein [Candidatus Cloacimonadota bacterium]